jgi:hypothetical protein
VIEGADIDETARLALFKRGTTVYRNGRPDTVDHVVIRNRWLYVRLANSQELVDAEKLGVELTTLSLKRSNGAYRG